MKKLLPTPMLVSYLLKFVVRVTIFLVIFLAYLINKKWLIAFSTKTVLYVISPLRIIWLGAMVMMLRHFIAPKTCSMAVRKAKKKEYVQKEDYDQLGLFDFIHRQNIAAWRVMLVWLVFNGFWGTLFLMHWIEAVDLVMLSVFFFLCDYICILFVCPFQTFIMKNRCCVNCRIYDWGHFMMFTPLVFIKNFYSWSLFFTACFILIHWELVYAKHPYRFWSGSNERLECINCKDKTCQVKRIIQGKRKIRKPMETKQDAS